MSSAWKSTTTTKMVVPLDDDKPLLNKRWFVNQPIKNGWTSRVHEKQTHEVT